MKKGDEGVSVQALQRALGISADGRFGARTEAAVKAFQTSRGLVADGIAGPATLAALSMSESAKRLTAGAIERAASDLDVPVSAVRALIDVESKGAGFLDDGRPVILFERHIMHRRLVAAGRDADALADRLPDIINTATGAYIGGRAEHNRLYLARQIEPVCAIESASWGLFQVMGFHWERLGYASAHDFEARMNQCESEHLASFVRFVIADPRLHGAIQRKEWALVAELYNGPQFRANSYDVRLAAADARYAKAG